MNEMENNQRDLGRVEGKLDLVIDSLKRIETKYDDRHEQLDKRLRKVEGRQHWYAGATAVIAYIASKIDPFSLLR